MRRLRRVRRSIILLRPSRSNRTIYYSIAIVPIKQGGLKPWGETAWGSGRERERRADDGLVRERAEGAAQASLEGQVVVVVAAVADDGGKNLVSWLVC